MVPTRAVATKNARLDKSSKLGNGVSVEVTKVESVGGQAHGPGEVSGAALRVTIRVTNRTKGAISMDLAVANLYYGPKAMPASSLSGPGVSALPPTIAPGTAGSGRFVYNVPTDGRDTIKVEFSYTTDAPTVVFTGPGER